PVGSIVVNMQREPLLPPAELAAAGKGRLPVTRVMAGLEAAGLGRRAARPGESAAARTARVRATAEALIAEGIEHAQRVQLEREQRAVLTGLNRPLVELPALAEGIDLGALYDLAERLTEQGPA
ncbi:MAG: hypothetical protein U0Q19_23065, partial [Kineosporiaceae bacterium]